MCICFFLFQYLFPDAAVEKPSEYTKTKAEQSSSPVKTEQDKTSDYVSL